jgi:hypothetical protein
MWCALQYRWPLPAVTVRPDLPLTVQKDAHAMLHATVLVALSCFAAEPPARTLPADGEVRVDADHGEVVFSAVVQHPKDKPCIDGWGERIQAFVGSARAEGRPTLFGDFFVFLTQADVDDVYDGLTRLGARPRVHYSREEGKKLEGREYLDGDPVLISVSWKDGDKWVERSYDDFVQEKAAHDGEDKVKPWTPHWVFHGSGAIHKAGTGCIACPCDCPGGIIADNRNPIYSPKPTVRFDWAKAPAAGTKVYVRIRTAKGDAPADNP